MQAQITAEREKRALIAASEGRKQEQINIATGEREASIARSEGEKQAAINRAQGEAAAIIAIATATAEALRQTGAAIREPGGLDAVNLKVAERYVDAFGKLAKTNNSLIVPGDVSNLSGMIASALQVVKSQARAGTTGS
jgi:regulator of protease activity HflC (stomatin/prohibitin superfamily)